MKLGKIGKIAAALAASGGLTAGVLTLGSSDAAAAGNYGPGAAYQVELSANAPSGSFWVWAALYPSKPGATSGTVEYQETDCVHLPHIATAAANDTGNGATWSIVGNQLTISNVNIIGDLATATLDVTLPSSTAPYYGHSSGLTVTIDSEVPNGPPLPPAFMYAPGPESQNQIAH